DLEVTPAGDGDTIWRARERTVSQGEQSVVEDTLLDQAPIGFFAARGDGKIVFMNQTLRAWLGVEGQAKDLTVADFGASGAGRALGKVRRAGAPPARSDVVLKAKGGKETPAVIVSTWPSGEKPPTSRSVVYGMTTSGAPQGLAQMPPAPSAGELGSMLDAMFASAPFGVARLDGPDPLRSVLADANPALLDLTHGAATPGRDFADLFKLDDAARDGLE